MKTKPEFAMMQAVRGMLQKNKLGSAQLTRLRVFRGAEHSHASQKPVAYEG
jgi:large subunit ribosomal protein L13